jgi:hypothetical protein
VPTLPENRNPILATVKKAIPVMKRKNRVRRKKGMRRIRRMRRIETVLQITNNINKL